MILDNYNELEIEMKMMNNNFLDVNWFIENQKKIDELLKDYILDFKFYNNDLNENLKKTQLEFNKNNLETLYKFELFEKMVKQTY